MTNGTKLALAAIAAYLAYRYRDHLVDALSTDAGVNLIATSAAAEPRPATPADLQSPGIAAVLNVPFPSLDMAMDTINRLFPGASGAFNYVQDKDGLWRITKP